MNPVPQSYRQAFPAALATTRGRGWSCPAVDVYALGNASFVGVHREHLVCAQLSGRAWLYQERDGRRWEGEAGPGHVCVTPAGSPKTWRRSGEGFVLMVSIPPSHVASVAERAIGRRGGSLRVRDQFDADDGRMVELARVLWRELSRERVGARLYVEAAVEQLVLQLIREHCDIDSAAAAPISISPHKLRLAKAFIHENLADALSVEGIARAVGMSAFHFAHAFRAATGVPPHRYLVERRMERAKALLRGSELSLTEIAQRVGYSSASHFSVAFQKIAKATPSGFRRAS